MAEQASPTLQAPRPPSNARTDLVVLGLIATAFLVAMTPVLGVWEPWESAVANALDLMRGEGSWWTVLQPGDKPVAELPYGLWPSAGLSTLMGVNEWSLRLPGVLLGVITCVAGFGITRRIFGRPAAWLSAFGLLAMPMFIFHTRLAFGTAVGMQCSALAALGFLHLLTRSDAGWRAQIGTWLALAGAGLAAGVAGLAGPLGVLSVGLATRARQIPAEQSSGLKSIMEHGLLLVLIATVVLFGLGQQRWGAIVALAGAGILLVALLFGADMRSVRQSGDLKRVAPLPMVLGALALLGAGWYLAVSHLPEGQSARALLLWLNDFDGPGGVKDRPGFDSFTHQIGFGLFPLGAFIPLAFADLIWSKTEQGEPQRVAALAIAGWFGLSFLAPALGISFSHVGFFFGAPAVAIAVGVYFHRAVTGPPQPLLAFIAVLLLALIDSNLKHQTQALADTIVGAEVDAFPPKLAGWGWARALSVTLLGVLLLYQGNMLRLTRAGIWRFFYPQRPPRPLEWWTAIWGFLGGQVAAALVVGLTIGARGFTNWVNGPGWGRLAIWARGLLIALVLFAIGYALAHFIWRWRYRQLQARERDGGVILELTDWIVAVLAPARHALLILGGILVAWAGFMNVGVTRAMTTNFSQKDIISRYAELKQGDEPLLTYQVGRSGMFYARELDTLDRQAFRTRMPQDERLFFMIPRKNLAAVNKNFRSITGRTLPILDDRSYRVLLASNQLKDGEEDFNPITRALIKELPRGVTKTNHVFDDRIELVGWQLNPAEPRPGAELTISLFWRAKKRITGRWKVFVHIDAPGQRIHGDHDPVAGMFPTDNWNPGDLIRDDHLIQVKRTTGRANYTFYVGLFRGNTRMPITKGDKDRENRAKIGRVRVQ